jgi:hypothetical protein
MVVKRIAPLAGVVFVAISVVAIAILGGNTPDGTASPATVTSFYMDHHGAQAAAAHILPIGTVFLVVFAAGTYVALPKRRGDLAKLGEIVFLIGAAVTAATLLAAASLHLALTEGVHDKISPVAAQALNAIDNHNDPLFVGIGILLIGGAVAMIPHRGALRWLGWIALVAGVVTFTPLGFFAVLVGLLWIIATGIFLVGWPPTTADSTASS